MGKIKLMNILGKKMYCLVISGEPRLLMSQLICFLANDGFDAEIVLDTCRELDINFKQCSLQQYKAMTMFGESKYNGKYDLITKSDMERLYGYLLQTKLKGAADVYCNGLLISHDCFGGCKGHLVTGLYIAPDSACIECFTCHLMLSPPQFVSHSHSKAENKVKHWGFSSSRWRSYVFASGFSENPNGELDEFKKRFVDMKALYKDNRCTVEGAREAVRNIFCVISSQISADLPAHLCSDEPVLNDNLRKSDTRCYESEIINCEHPPNVSLALFDHFGNSHSETNKRIKQSLQCQLKINKGIVKHYLKSDCSSFEGVMTNTSFQKLCEYEFVGKLLGLREELFTLAVSKANTSNEQEFRGNLEVLQKHGTELVYFLLENKAELSQVICNINN